MIRLPGKWALWSFIEGVALDGLFIFGLSIQARKILGGGLVRHDGWRILLVIGLSTLAVMLVTACTVEWVCRWRLRHEA